MSPASQRRDTRASARRRPKLRDTSVKLSEVKSISAGSSGGPAIDLRVDPLERADEFRPTLGVARRLERAGAVLLLERRQLGKQPLAPLLQALTGLVGGAGATDALRWPRRRPRE